MPLILFVIIFIAEFFTSPKVLLFYDQIEYLRIVSTNNFWQVFSLGHFPIHPFFLAFFWITSRITLPNYTALIFSLVSGILIYKISRKVFNDKYFWIPAVMFLLFPGIWMINTNLMIQSMLLTFYLLALYSFIKNKPLLFLISTFLMIGIHVDGAYWLVSIFLFPFLFKKELKLNKKQIMKFVKIAFLSIFLSAIFYAVMYLFVRKDFGGSTEQILAYSSFGILRIVRNIWVCFINNFGSITPFVLAYLLYKNVRNRSEWICWLILILLISIGGAYWEGDLMMRRIVFAGVFLSFTFYRYLGKKAVFLILFLLPITILNAALYYKNLPTVPLISMQKEIDELPKNQVLIQSHYYYPFTKYNGKILWFEDDNLDQIAGYLKNGVRVFLTKESVTAPYLLIVGNNYHITSVGRVGDSSSRSLFENYDVSSYADSLELTSPNVKQISKNAGETVVFYGTGFWQRLSRLRINYGDIGVWAWALVTNHRDATGWTYKDVRGVWLQI